MIKFFRRIRKDLLASGKTNQYLKYAFGEIVLVVIGILIALQINNWNEERKETRILKEYLTKIKAHTQQDIRALDTIKHYRSQMDVFSKKVRDVILNKKEKENQIMMMQAGVVFADFAFKPNTGGYEALKNSSYFGKINNTRLDSLLIQYHKILADLAENEGSYNDYIVSQEAYISNNFDRTLILASAFLSQEELAKRATPQSEYTKSFQEYTSSIPYRNVISLAAFQFETMVKQYAQLIAVGKHIVAEIDTLTNK